MKDLKVEYRKHKRMGVWLLTPAFLAVLSLWVSIVYRTPTEQRLAQGYSNLFYQMPLLNCVVMPVMIAVLASRLCDMEVKGSTFRLLFTLQKKSSFYDLKFCSEAVHLLWFALGEGCVILLFGRLFHFTESLSLSLLCRHMGITFLVSLVILSLQHMLSLLSANQIVPLLVGLAGSFLGLFSLYFPTEVSRFVLWSYFGAFLPFGMNWDQATRITTFYPIPFPTKTLVGFVLFGILFYFVCRFIFLKKEV